MSRSGVAILILISASAALAQAPQPAPPVASQTNVPWAVSVVHTINLQKMVERMRDQQNVRVGVAGTAPRDVYNITTGLIVDDLGHVVTRLANLDPQDKEHKLTVTSSDGTTAEARLIGVDFATGFAVLEVASLAALMPRIAAPAGLAHGAAVKILSSDVQPASMTRRGYLAPAITVSQGHIAAGSLYATARGALTLLSNSLLARSDGSVVVTPDNQVVGIAQYAGFGRAYLYPVAFIRDTVARRVIEKRDNVAAGWLGARGDGVVQLSDADFSALGLDRRAGVIVREVTPQGPAAQAGLLPADVITSVDGFDIAGTADLKALLAPLPAGQTVKLKALRANQTVELKAVLGARPLTETVSLIDQLLEPALSQREQLEQRFEELRDLFVAYHKSPASRERNEAIRELEIEIRQILDGLRALGPDSRVLSQPKPDPRQPQREILAGNLTATPDTSFDAGFTARELTSQLAAILQARGGVLVSNVVKDSPAAQAGLKAGDIIVGTRERVLLRAAQLQALLSAQRGPIALSVVRDKQPIVLSLNLQ